MSARRRKFVPVNTIYVTFRSQKDRSALISNKSLSRRTISWRYAWTWKTVHGTEAPKQRFKNGLWTNLTGRINRSSPKKEIVRQWVLNRFFSHMFSVDTSLSNLAIKKCQYLHHKRCRFFLWIFNFDITFVFIVIPNRLKYYV